MNDPEDMVVSPADKCGEMLRSAGFQESVNRRLRHWRQLAFINDDTARTIDDLYEIYGRKPVLE